MAQEGRFCTESSSMGHMTCQNAWDDDIVTNTIWHPGSSGLDEYTTIYVNKKIVITKVTVQQYKWSTGYASKMSLNINGDIKDMRPVRRNDFELMEYSPILPLTTSSVQLIITEVGPGRGSAFGGIVAIKLFGCYQEEEVKSTAPRSEDVRAELDWDLSYEYDDDESQATDKKEEDRRGKMKGRRVPEEEMDWKMFGTFRSDGNLGSDYKENADLVSEERLVRSNLPTFDSRSVDMDYDETRVETRKESPGSKRSLYIVSGVALVISIILVGVIMVYGFKARRV